MSDDNPTSKPVNPEGAFTKLLNYIKNSRPVQYGLELGNSIINSNAAKKGTELFNYIQETAAYKILTGRAVSTTIAITFGALALAGVSAVAFPVAIIGAVAIGIGVVVDVMTVRGSRQLHQENDLIVKNRTAKSKQDVFLKLEPELAKALEKDLYKPNREGKRSVNQRYIKDSIIDASTLNYGKAMLKNAVMAIASTARAIGTGNPIKIAYTAVTTAFGMYSEGSATFQINDKQLECQKNIDAERNKLDTPGYNNRKELKAATREQRIQTMALERLIVEKPNKETYPPTGTFRHGTAEQIQNRFKVIKDEIAAKEKAVNTSRHPVLAFTRSVGQDVIRTFNPFSKYTAPQNLVVPQHANLTKALDKHEKSAEASRNESARIVNTNDAKIMHNIKKDLSSHKTESNNNKVKHSLLQPKNVTEKIHSK